MDDQNLDLYPAEEAPTTSPPSPRRPQTGALLLAALLVVAVVVTGYFVFFRGGDEATPAEEAAAEAVPPPEVAPAPVEADAEEIPLPPLDETDEVVRDLVSVLSSHPAVVAWLATDDLVRTFTVVVSNVANGEPPAGHVPVLRPAGAFQVQQVGGGVYVDPRSYDRYDALAAAITSVEPSAAADVYRRLKPRIEDAYRELGYPDTPFDDTMERALVVLLSTPIPDGQIPLKTSGAEAWAFTDPTLESLQPAQKHLLRFGPENARAVQAALRRIAAEIGVPADRLPSPR